MYQVHGTLHHHCYQYLSAKILLVVIFCSFKDFLGSNRIGSEPWSVCISSVTGQFIQLCGIPGNMANVRSRKVSK